MTSSPSSSWNPNQYEKFKNERSQPFFDLMNMVHPIPNGTAIDLGCGTGELTSALHRHLQAAATIGLDSSDTMMQDAQKFAGNGLSFIYGDINTWTADKKYGVIFSNAALQWCDNHPELFKRLHEALVPGGQLAVQMPMNHDYPTHTLAAKMSHEEPWKTLLKGQTYEKANTMLLAEDYATLLFKLGFAEQKAYVEIYGHKLESREEVVEWVKGSMLTHFRSRLSEEDYKKFLTEYKKRLFEILPDDKPFFYPFKRIFLWARR